MGPAARVLDGPVGQVQVEGPDRCQALAVVDPLHGDLRLLASSGDRCPRHGAQAPFPGGGNLGGQVQAGNARVVTLQVCPKELAQEIGQRLQAVVIQSGLAFAQVVHQ